MKITNDDVKHVARLAELKFTAGEIEKITPQLDRILEHVARISAVDTEGVEGTSHVMDVKNVFREDIPAGDTVTQRQALRNAPLEQDDGFRVPRID
jgi:aspartyl-tRNA(Asn)/glutamyl-tRNA(Gln) amidotransferase subunit C